VSVARLSIVAQQHTHISTNVHTFELSYEFHLTPWQNQDSQSVADHINVTSESSGSVFKKFWNSAVGNVCFIDFLVPRNTVCCIK